MRLRSSPWVYSLKSENSSDEPFAVDFLAPADMPPSLFFTAKSRTSSLAIYSFVSRSLIISDLLFQQFVNNVLDPDSVGHGFKIKEHPVS